MKRFARTFALCVAIALINCLLLALSATVNLAAHKLLRHDFVTTFIKTFILCIEWGWPVVLFLVLSLKRLTRLLGYSWMKNIAVGALFYPFALFSLFQEFKKFAFWSGTLQHPPTQPIVFLLLSIGMYAFAGSFIFNVLFSFPVTILAFGTLGSITSILLFKFFPEIYNKTAPNPEASPPHLPENPQPSTFD